MDHPPSNGNWYVLRSEDSSFYSFPFGTAGDVPVPGDFDADGKADAAIYRPTSGFWYVPRSSDGTTTITRFGIGGDVPVNADYDGDGRHDIAIFRPGLGQWWIERTTAGSVALQWRSSCPDSAGRLHWRCKSRHRNLPAVEWQLVYLAQRKPQLLLISLRHDGRRTIAGRLRRRFEV